VPGNFGVATALEYRLHPVTDVLAGTLMYPAGRIPELLQAFVKFVAAAPDETCVVGAVLPSEQGTLFQMMVFYCGDPRLGNDLLRPLRAPLKPQEDNVRAERRAASTGCFMSGLLLSRERRDGSDRRTQWFKLVVGIRLLAEKTPSKKKVD
jgi:hypothetical protein